MTISVRPTALAKGAVDETNDRAKTRAAAGLAAMHIIHSGLEPEATMRVGACYLNATEVKRMRPAGETEVTPELLSDQWFVRADTRHVIPSRGR